MAQIFPKWTNDIPKIAPPVLLIIGAFATFVVWYWFSPKHTDVGYQPEQPVPYSHKLHAGDLGIDCRYCHTYAEKGPAAGVPPTQTCMNCHSQVKTNSPKLKPVRDSWESGDPVKWVRIHKIPDYAYFDHSAHLNIAGGKAAVGCVECHGRVDQMVVVQQVEPLSMGWCLECHRSARGRSGNVQSGVMLRPRNEVANMTWEPSESWTKEANEIAKGLVSPTVSCSGCHR
jgi:hypothetical protein